MASDRLDIYCISKQHLHAVVSSFGIKFLLLHSYRIEILAEMFCHRSHSLNHDEIVFLGRIFPLTFWKCSRDAFHSSEAFMKVFKWLKFLRFISKWKRYISMPFNLFKLYETSKSLSEPLFQLAFWYWFLFFKNHYLHFNRLSQDDKTIKTISAQPKPPDVVFAHYTTISGLDFNKFLPIKFRISFFLSLSLHLPRNDINTGNKHIHWFSSPLWTGILLLWKPSL